MGDVLRVVRSFLSPLVEHGRRRTVVFLGHCFVYKMHVYGCMPMYVCVRLCVCACACTRACIICLGLYRKGAVFAQ